MSPEVEQALIDASAGMVGNPISWKRLPANARQLFRALKGNPSFSEKQRFYLSRWWFGVTDEQVKSINDACPPAFQFEPRRDAQGNGYLCADILTDAIDNGFLKALRPLVEDLDLHYRLPEDWPQEEEQPADTK